jgi:D-alanyl-D-alanine dipeptidase
MIKRKGKFYIAVSLLLFATTYAFAQSQGLPKGFVYVSDIASNIIIDIRYFTNYNFTGARVEGYRAPVAILTKEAAIALSRAADEFESMGYIVKIFDAYRPTRAVRYFNKWLNDNGPLADRNKPYFFPRVDKKLLFKLGYLSNRSGHSRGSTIDITLVDKKTGKELDMGSPYDFLDEVSSYDSKTISPQQFANRKLLREVMIKNGFRPYNKEWWHFTLANEPFSNKYFDFPVE